MQSRYRLETIFKQDSYFLSCTLIRCTRNLLLKMMKEEKNNDSRRRLRKSRNNMNIYNEEKLENDEIIEVEYSFSLVKKKLARERKNWKVENMRIQII